MKNYSLIFVLIILFSNNLFAQDVVVNKQNGSSYRRTAPDGDCSNNYSSKGNVNPYTGKAGTVPCNESGDVKFETGAYGTGEYLLVPAIVRRDPKGTAIRFNTCGTAIMALMDRSAIYDLTDKEKQRFTPETILTVAESRFRMATEFIPDNYLYHLNLGVVLYRQKRLSEALEEINRAIKLNPNDKISQEYKEIIHREKVTVRIIEEKQDQ